MVSNDRCKQGGHGSTEDSPPWYRESEDEWRVHQERLLRDALEMSLERQIGVSRLKQRRGDGVGMGLKLET